MAPVSRAKPVMLAMVIESLSRLSVSLPVRSGGHGTRGATIVRGGHKRAARAEGPRRA